ncbi:hypothetical protein BASA81_010148 [Batrachochytrium salamandrivorans]|nr:hypothetical protein BASA81_010148 [Batrachochytrium salamandrivorans]
MKSFVKARVLTREAQRVGVITLANDADGALTAPVRRDLIRGLNFLHTSECKAIVLAGGSSKCFSSGVDSAQFALGEWNSSPNLQDVVVAVNKSPLPIIAALEGVVAGGGLELALACNFRVGNLKTVMSLPETAKYGLLPSAQGTQRLPRVVGVERAVELILTGEQVKGQHAKELGLLHQLVDPSAEEDVFESSLLLADSILVDTPIPEVSLLPQPQALSNDQLEALKEKFASLPQDVVQAVIAAVNASAKLDFKQGVQYEQLLFRQLLVARTRFQA